MQQYILFSSAYCPARDGALNLASLFFAGVPDTHDLGSGVMVAGATPTDEELFEFTVRTSCTPGIYTSVVGGVKQSCWYLIDDRCNNPTMEKFNL